jgi:hypothetical protein
MLWIITGSFVGMLFGLLVVFAPETAKLGLEYALNFAFVVTLALIIKYVRPYLDSFE